MRDLLWGDSADVLRGVVVDAAIELDRLSRGENWDCGPIDVLSEKLAVYSRAIGECDAHGNNLEGMYAVNSAFGKYIHEASMEIVDGTKTREFAMHCSRGVGRVAQEMRDIRRLAMVRIKDLMYFCCGLSAGVAGRGNMLFHVPAA